MQSQQFAALVAAQPANGLFRFSLAQALLADNHPAEALEHLQFCAGQKADWMLPRLLLGQTLLGLGRRAEAKPWLEQALQLAITQDHDDPALEVRRLLAEIS